jgi:CRISPR/Cas system-associated endonuclease Cas1
LPIFLNADIGVLILEHSAITITQPLIIECQENNTAVIFCDERHLPYSTILPISEGYCAAKASQFVISPDLTSFANFSKRIKGLSNCLSVLA